MQEAIYRAQVDENTIFFGRTNFTANHIADFMSAEKLQNPTLFIFSQDFSTRYHDIAHGWLNIAYLQHKNMLIFIERIASSKPCPTKRQKSPESKATLYLFAIFSKKRDAIAALDGTYDITRHRFKCFLGVLRPL